MAKVLPSPDAFAWCLSGCRLYEAKKYLEAEAAFEKALTLDAALIYPHLFLGDMYVYKSRFEEAEVAYKGAIRIRSQTSHIYKKLGVLYKAWQRPEDAKAVYQAALKINPSDFEAQQNIDALMKVTEKRKYGGLTRLLRKSE